MVPHSDHSDCWTGLVGMQRKPPALAFEPAGPRQQSTMDIFMRSRLEELRGGSTSAGDSRTLPARRRLILDVYEVLRRADLPGGLSSGSVALEIVQSDSKMFAASSFAGRSSAATAEQLEPWIDAALRALEDTGHVYRAGMGEFFLTSISDRRLDEKDLDDLLALAFSSSSLWTIAALAAVQTESARQAPTGGTPTGDGHTGGVDGPRDRGGMNKRKRTTIGGPTQVYTTAYEIQAKREPDVQRPACQWGWKGGRPLHQYLSIGRECTGKLATGAMHRMWSAALRRTSKAVLCTSTMGPAPRPQQGSGPWPSCMEYSASGEYVLCARTDGNLTVFKSSSTLQRMRNTWDEAASLASLDPVRDVRGGLRSIDCVHWNPANRNELATSSRSSSELHVFDMKVCGIASSRGPQHSRNTPTTIFSQASSHITGNVLDFAFVPSAPSMMIAGMSMGAVVVWDARNPKTSKGAMRQEDGGVCYLQVLRDGHSVVAGTTNGAVHVWDIRAARASMSVMSIGGRNPDKPIFSAHVQEQLPLLNADNDIVPGSLAATTDDSHLRTYSLEPVHETDMAFAFGHRTVGVLNLLSGRVTHAYTSSRPDTRDTQRRRLAWVASPSGHSTLAMRVSDEPCMSLFRLRTPQGPKHSFGHTAASVQHIMKEQLIQTPRAVSALCANPADSTLGLGFREGTVACLRFGQGSADSNFSDDDARDFS